jgi:hypothetical protein
MSLSSGNPAHPVGSDPGIDAVTCSCGAVMRVARQRGHQVQRCPSCGDELFVLPQSPYPARRPRPDENRGDEYAAPARTSRPAHGTTFHHRLAAALSLPAQIPTAEPIDVEPIAAEPVTATSAARSPRAAAVVVPEVVGSYPEKAPHGGGTLEGRAPDQPGRPLWRRPKLLIILAGMLLAATVAMSWWSNARERWAQAMRHHADVGMRAYAEGDFATTKAQLGEALRLLGLLQWPARWLGRTTRYARELRAERLRDGGISVEQAYREAAICEDLLTASLQEMVRDTARALRRAGPEDAKAQFESRYRGQAVIFDTTLTPSAAGSGPTIPLLLKVDDWLFRVDTAALDVLRNMPGDDPHRVIFGARLDTLAEGDAGGREWLIRLQPSSGVLFTYAPSMERLGWSVRRPFELEPDMQTILERQRAEVQGWSAD